MNKAEVIKNLKEKLSMYEDLKKSIGYDESLFVKPEGMTQSFYEKEILSKVPKLTERRLFNNAYLNTCIEQVKELIKKWETSLEIS